MSEQEIESKKKLDGWVRTRLRKEFQESFYSKCDELKMTPFKLGSHAIEEFLKKDKLRSVDSMESIEQRTEDLARDETISDADIQRVIYEIDKRIKTKNSIKKGGAFHTENSIVDIKSLVMGGGEPSFYELDYHFTFWRHMAMLTNALARRGSNMTPKVKALFKAVEARAERSRYNGNLNADQIAFKRHAMYKGKIVK